MITADELVISARSLCGVPWKHRGRSINGLDCIGMVLLAARKAGLDLHLQTGVRDRRDYSRRAQPEMLDIVRRACTQIERPEHGALLLFQFEGDEHPRHFGIFTNAATLIHAECRTRKRVIEHGYRAQWIRWTASSWRLPGVEY